MSRDRRPADRKLRGDLSRRQLGVAHELEDAAADRVGDDGCGEHNA
jgi:hypothetical protein